MEGRRAEEERREAVLEGITRVSRKTAHGLNNLLMVLMGGLDMYDERRQSDPEGAERALGMVRDAVAGVRDLAATLQLLRGPKKSETREDDVAEIVRAWAERALDAVPEGIRLDCHAAAGAAVAVVDRAAFEAALDALLANAIEAMPDGGTVTVRTEGVRREGASRFVIEFEDEGHGMDAATRARLFEPFFTTKRGHQVGADGKAHEGLGLARVWGVVHRAEGTIRIESEVGEGTAVRIELPVVRLEEASGTEADPAHAAEAVDAPAVPTDPAVKVVLVVDDDPSVREVMVAGLEEAGYRAIAAGGGREALLLARAYEGEIHLLVTDVVMPGMNGREVARAIREQRPDTPVLYVSGFTTDVLSIFDGVVPTPFLQKPFDPQTLTDQVRALA